MSNVACMARFQLLEQKRCSRSTSTLSGEPEKVRLCPMPLSIPESARFMTDLRRSLGATALGA